MVSDRLGFFIRAIRNKLNLSQTRFGETIGISRDRVVKIELGLRKLDVDTLDEIRATHSVSIDKLLDKARHRND